MLTDTEKAALVDIINKAITVSHGEGEALGTSRHKNAQCEECARREEQRNIETYGRDGTWPKKEQHVPPPVGFSIADRRELAEKVVSDIERLLAERERIDARNEETNNADQNTTPAAEAVERVAKAMWDGPGFPNGRMLRHKRKSDDDYMTWAEVNSYDWVGYEGMDRCRATATAAIKEHAAYLWERSDGDFRTTLYSIMSHAYKLGAQDYELGMADGDGYASRMVDEERTAALTLLLGPRPEGDTDAN